MSGDMQDIEGLFLKK